MSSYFPQVKLRILMGTYALSAGYYDAYYKRAQQVPQWICTCLNMIWIFRNFIIFEIILLFWKNSLYSGRVVALILLTFSEVSTIPFMMSKWYQLYLLISPIQGQWQYYLTFLLDNS